MIGDSRTACRTYLSADNLFEDYFYFIYYIGGGVAQDNVQLHYDVVQKSNLVSKYSAVVGFVVRKGSVCIAQYYASLFPPTLQRAKPSNAL